MPQITQPEQSKDAKTIG